MTSETSKEWTERNGYRVSATEKKGLYVFKSRNNRLDSYSLAWPCLITQSEVLDNDVYLERSSSEELGTIVFNIWEVQITGKKLWKPPAVSRVSALVNLDKIHERSS
jgi:hypothetical protein